MCDPDTWKLYCVEYPASLKLGRPAVIGCRVVTKVGRTKWAVQFCRCYVGQRWCLMYGKTAVWVDCILWKDKGLKALQFTATRNGDDVNLPTSFSFVYENDTPESLAMLAE